MRTWLGRLSVYVALSGCVGSGAMRTLSGEAPAGATDIFAIDTQGRSAHADVVDGAFTVALEPGAPAVLFFATADGVVAPLVFADGHGGLQSVIPDFSGSLALGAITIVDPSAARFEGETGPTATSEENPLELIDSDDDGSSDFEDADDDDDGIEDAEDADSDGDGVDDDDADLDLDDDGRPDEADDDDDDDGLDDDEDDDDDDDGVSDDEDEDDHDGGDDDEADEDEDGDEEDGDEEDGDEEDGDDESEDSDDDAEDDDDEEEDDDEEDDDESEDSDDDDTDE